jgi:hypothetical protein
LNLLPGEKSQSLTNSARAGSCSNSRRTSGEQTCRAMEGSSTPAKVPGGRDSGEEESAAATGCRPASYLLNRLAHRGRGEARRPCLGASAGTRTPAHGTTSSGAGTRGRGGGAGAWRSLWRRAGGHGAGAWGRAREASSEPPAAVVGGPLGSTLASCVLGLHLGE